MASLALRLERLERQAQSMRPRRRPLCRYRADPAGYFRDVLRVRWWRVQAEIARALLEPPYRVFVLASHGVGKTWLAAALVSWWFDSRDPGAAVTTAPNFRQVKDLLWKEVRLQRSRAGLGGFAGPGMPLLSTAPDHFAKGVTSATGEGFQGRHDLDLLFVLDEAIGCPGFVYETLGTMFSPTGRHAALAIGNPTDTTSVAYAEAMSGKWRVIQMSALDHPNLAAELAGREPPFPAAVRLSQVDEQLRDWCDPVPESDHVATDVLWPPVPGTPLGRPRWLRPGPVAEARVLGRWPSQGTYGVWSDALWQAACGTAAVPANTCPEIGCDVARYGDDDTVIHARVGPASVHHERHNGWDVVQTAGRLKELARELAARHNWPVGRVLIKVDDDGVGGGVVDLHDCWRDGGPGYRVVPVNAGSSPRRPSDYPNKRSELWFAAAALARHGLLRLGGLDRAARERLRQEAMAPTWRLDPAGRRVVEPKSDTREKIGRSPDGMDAVNLAYYDAGVALAPEFVGAPPPPPRDRPPAVFGGEPRPQKRRLFGR